MKKYNKPEILCNEIKINNNLANSLSGSLNTNFVEDTDVVVEWDNFMN